jgi:hypothetical protein
MHLAHTIIKSYCNYGAVLIYRGNGSIYSYKKVFRKKEKSIIFTWNISVFHSYQQILFLDT